MSFVDGDVKERHSERPDLIGQVGMVGDHHRHRHVQLTATVAPQQVQEAVVLLRRQYRDAFGFGRLRQPEVHVERSRDLLGEVTLQRITSRGQSRQVENRPLHERATGLLGGVLIQRDDVGAGRRQETAHRGDQTGSVGAAQQQPADILGRQVSAALPRVAALFGADIRCRRHPLIPLVGPVEPGLPFRVSFRQQATRLPRRKTAQR